MKDELKVTEYKNHNGKKRYRVHQLPSYYAVGEHTLENGSKFEFDDELTERALERTKELIKQDEIRPVHLNHWNFDRDDNKSPDADCPNFALMDNFTKTTKKVGKEDKVLVKHDIYDLTWTDLNKMERLGGRSMQMLNPKADPKFDSLAFMSSLPAKVKGLGIIKLDLSKVTEPKNEEDKKLSFIDNADLPEGNKEFAINFSEKTKNKLAVILFKEGDMPEDEEYNEEEEIEGEGGEEENFDFGEDEDEGEEFEEEGAEEEFEPEAEETFDTEEETEKSEPDGGEEVADITVDELEDIIEDKFNGFMDRLMEKLELMLLKQSQGSEIAPAAPPQPVGFGEKQKRSFAAFFVERQKKINNIAVVELGVNGETIYDKSKSLLEDMNVLQEKIIIGFENRNFKSVAVAFKEQAKLISDNIAPVIDPPEFRSHDEKRVKALFAETMPGNLTTYPKISECWNEWSQGERVENKDGSFRNAAIFQEWKSGKKDKTYEFVTYYNTVFAPGEGIEERIPVPKNNKK